MMPGEVERGAMLWRTGGLLLAMLLIVALPFIMTHDSFKAFFQAGEEVSRAAKVEALVYRITNQNHTAESAIQHWLADDPSSPAGSVTLAVEKEIPRLLNDLRRATGSNARQQRLVAQLSTMEKGRLAWLHQAVQRFQRGDRAGAQEALRDVNELFRIDIVANTVIAHAEQALRQRRQAARRQADGSRLVLALTAATQWLILMIMLLVTGRRTGRLQVQAHERQTLQWGQMILQAVREPIALFDHNLRSLLVNTAFSELYGVSQESHAQYLEDIGQGAWTDAVLLQRLRDVLRSNQELSDFELHQRTADGIERYVVVNARRLKQQGNDGSVLLLTVRDITARALVERQVKKRNHQLASKVAQISDVNRELEAFSGSISHDLRAPLRHITAFAQKLEEHLGEEVDHTTRHYLRVVRDASRRMLQMIEDLLAFSRLGHSALRLKTIDMQALVKETCAMVASEAPGRRIIWRIDPLPTVVGDENTLRMVWQNLIGNAVKYTGQRDAAHIEISARRHHGGEHEFIVADDGVGFDMRYADKLFGIFQRLHKASAFPGNGIGLANVRRIVMRHGGRVWAESEPGHGARFHFTLPALMPPPPLPLKYL